MHSSMRCCIWKKHKRQSANIDDLAQQQSLVLKKKQNSLHNWKISNKLPSSIPEKCHGKSIKVCSSKCCEQHLSTNIQLCTSPRNTDLVNNLFCWHPIAAVFWTENNEKQLHSAVHVIPNSHCIHQKMLRHSHLNQLLDLFSSCSKKQKLLLIRVPKKKTVLAAPPFMFAIVVPARNIETIAQGIRHAHDSSQPRKCNKFFVPGTVHESIHGNIPWRCEP